MSEKKKKFLKKVNQKKKINLSEPKKISQRTANIIFLGSLVSLLTLSVLTIVISFTRQAIPRNTEIKTEQKQEVNKDIDNSLQLFLDGYVSAYFNYEGSPDTQKEEQERLNSYYKQVPVVKAQEQVRLPSKLVTLKLQQVKNSVATYKVTYETGAQEKQKITVNFSIPYGEDKTGYFVSGLPFFEPVSDLKSSEKSQEQLTLGAVDRIDEKEREKLESFVQVFFQNYTSSQDNLDVVAKGVRSISGAIFKSIDFSYFKPEEKYIVAYVQVTFEIAGTAHSENFTLTMEAKENSYFVTKLEHSIPVDYAK